MKNLNPKFGGCPTSSHKKYCLKEYVEAIRALTYDNFDILLGDTSKVRISSRDISIKDIMKD